APAGGATAGDPRFFRNQQHPELGAGCAPPAAPHPHPNDRAFPAHPPPPARRFRFHGDTRLRAVLPHPDPRPPGRHPRASAGHLDGDREPGPQRGGVDLPLEGVQGDHPQGRRARPYFPESTRTHRLTLSLFETIVEHGDAGPQAPPAGSMVWLERRRASTEYTAGSTRRVSAVEEISPPITTRASGRWISEPIPWESAAGRKPTTATMADTTMGRKRITHPRTMASRGGRPSAWAWRMEDTSTTPLSTLTPKTAM